MIGELVLHTLVQGELFFVFSLSVSVPDKFADNTESLLGVLVGVCSTAFCLPLPLPYSQKVSATECVIDLFMELCNSSLSQYLFTL